LGDSQERVAYSPGWYRETLIATAPCQAEETDV
jgi:hypothetical protein